MISYEDAQLLFGRMVNRTATVGDCLLYVQFELQEAMKVLPPDAKDNKTDGWHASACALRGFATVLQLRERLSKLGVDGQSMVTK